MASPTSLRGEMMDQVAHSCSWNLPFLHIQHFLIGNLETRFRPLHNGHVPRSFSSQGYREGRECEKCLLGAPPR